jgi:peroxiredoxin
LQKTYDEFDKRDTVVIAISQEDKDLTSARKFLKAFKGKTPLFDIVADLDREKTRRFDRTTSYLIDKNGKVREIFPAMVHMRPDWRAVLNRIDAMMEPKGMKVMDPNPSGDNLTP